MQWVADCPNFGGLGGHSLVLSDCDLVASRIVVGIYIGVDLWLGIDLWWVHYLNGWSDCC